MFNYNPDYPITAFKSLNSNQPKWEIIDFFDGKPFKGVFPVGAVISANLNYIARKTNEFIGYEVSPCQNAPITHYDNGVTICYVEPVFNLRQDKFDGILDYINELAFMSEVAKKRGKDRYISHVDYQELHPFFLKLKDIPFIAVNADPNDPESIFDTDYIYDYLVTDGLLKVRENDNIIKKLGVVKGKNGIEYQEYKLKDYEALFVLDLEELLFGTIQFPKYKQCRGCGEIFVANNSNKFYCVRCDTPERARKRKKESRKDELYKLHEQIKNIYRHRENQARCFSDIRSDDKELADAISMECGNFDKEYAYYKKQVNCTIKDVNPKYDASINTRKKLLEWLKKKKETIIKENINAKNDETIERDRLDHESEGEKT